jgi:hypothetical protein
MTAVSYDVVESDDLTVFKDCCNAKLAQGWQLHGAMFVTPPGPMEAAVFYQAFVRYK